MLKKGTPRMILRAALLTMAMGWWLPLSAAQVELAVDTASARAVLQALTNPNLTRAEALAVAALPGNAAMIEKIRSFGKPAGAELFADALIAAVNSQPPPQKMFNFDRVRANAAVDLAALDAIDQPAANFRSRVLERVSAFSPDALHIAAKGVVIAGGPASGFAFNEPVAYLNIDNFSGDAAAVRVIMAHEIYHAVQAAAGAAVRDRRVLGFDDQEFARIKSGLARRCYALESMFGDFLREGSASYVGDVMELAGDEGPSSKWHKNRFEEGLRSLEESFTLLDLSVIGLTAEPPASYERVYALGFYHHELLYFPAYVVAKAIALDQGPGALAGLLDQPGSAFLRRYMALPLYGKDAVHPRLGAATERWAGLLRGSCARRPPVPEVRRAR